MTSNLDTGRSRGDRERARAYLREFLPGMFGYVVAVVLVVTVGGLDGDAPTRFAWALLPVLPTLWIAVAMARHLRRLDEFAQLVLLRALAVGFGTALTAAVVVGFLELAGAGIPTPTFLVFAAGMAGTGTAAAVLSRS